MSVSASYIITLREFDISVKNESEFLNLDKIRLKRKSHNETHKFYGQFTLFRDLTLEDDVDVVGELYQQQGGEYRKLAYHVKGKLCPFLDISVLYVALAEAAGLAKKVRNKKCYLIITSLHLLLIYLFFYSTSKSVRSLRVHMNLPMDGNLTQKKLHLFLQLETT